MSPEPLIAILALAGISVFSCWRVIRWFFDGPAGPNPWDEETERSIHQPDAVPICTRCLEAHPPEAHFCPNCGVPVDALVPFSPYSYVFAFGDMLRVGTTGRFQANWVTLLGFLLLPLAFLPLLLAFVYWFFFLRNLARRRTDRAVPPLEPDQRREVIGE